MKILTFLSALLLTIATVAGKSPKHSKMTEQNSDAKVLIHTSMGDITVKLYGDTPRHRDNFLKLVKEGYYDGVLFHRVINEFMIQTGDPDSKTADSTAMLGAGGPGYDIEAEILYPRHFHKRGALAAARTGDNVNPERRSSGSQFYIVTGRKVNESELKGLEHNMQMQRMQEIFDNLSREHRDSIMTLRRNRDQAGLTALRDSLVAQTEKLAAAEKFELTPEQREAYTTVGGTPHLDGTYTVFGEVTDGMDVVDAIEKVQTGRADRPVQDVKVISMKVID